MSTSPATADRILHGGVVRTMDPALPHASALAIRGDEVIAVGDDAEMLALAGPDTRVDDLDGRGVLPGINDAHLHAVWLGAIWPHLFFGTGDETPSGRLLADEAARRGAIRNAWRLLASLGVTSYTDPGIGPGEDEGETGCFGSAVLGSYLALVGTPEQTARVTMLRLYGLIDGPSDPDAFERGLREPSPAGNPRWFAVPGVKIFGDGIPPMHQAWTTLPYPDGGHGGLLTGEGDEAARAAALDRMVRAAASAGLQVAVHATGDRTIEAVLDALDGVAVRPAAPHYLVHADLVRPDQLDRMAAAGVGLDVQPLLAEHTGDWLSARVSAEMARASWPLGAILDSGARAVLSSDAPIATPDWRRTVAASATLLRRAGRKTRRGDDQRRLYEMLTTVPAAQDGAADWKGRIRPGYVADLVVLSEDPLGVPALEATRLEIEETIVGGRTVYARP